MIDLESFIDEIESFFDTVLMQGILWNDQKLQQLKELEKKCRELSFHSASGILKEILVLSHQDSPDESVLTEKYLQLSSYFHLMKDLINFEKAVKKLLR